MGAADFWDFLDELRRRRAMFWFLMVANGLGIVYGYYYYVQVGQFDPSSPYFRAYRWWLFIPDSPNAVLLMSASLVLERFGRRSRLLDGLAFTSMVYVGLWTTALFLLFPQQLHTFDFARFPDSANPVLFVSHMGMPLEAMLLVPAMRRSYPSACLLAGVSAWLALNVWLDYGRVHLHPAPFVVDHAAIHHVAPWLAAITLAGWVLLVRVGLRRPRTTATV